jgi:ParB-like chromosome segregation protein Spo0J
MGIGRCKTILKPIKELMPAGYNPRTISKQAKKGLSNSIDKFGLVQPIVWNKRTGNIVGGHQRLYDLTEKGAEVTDVVEVNLTLDEEKALNIALNHKGIQGEFIEEEIGLLVDSIGDTKLIEDLDLSSLKDKHVWHDDLESDDNEIVISDAVKIKIELRIPEEAVREEIRQSIQDIIELSFNDKGIVCK